MTTGLTCISVARSSDLNKMNGRYTRQKVPLAVHGVSRSSTENEPLPPTLLPTLLDGPFTPFFQIYSNEQIDKQESTLVTSGESSPTDLCRLSNFGWVTGNTTERSSLYSSYTWADDISWGDEYDRRASGNVRSLFEEIDTVLFSEMSSVQSSARSTNLEKECQEWMSQFPHLRISGARIFPQQDLGFQFIPVDKPAAPSQTENDLLIDLTLESSDMSSNNHDAQNLLVTGRQIVAQMVPKPLIITEDRARDHRDPYAFLHEEILAQDGYFEEIIAVDYKTEHCDALVTARHPNRARAAKRGLPPLTPNACVKDSVFSMTFDMAWTEIVSWMRYLFKQYQDYVLSENSKNIIPPLNIYDLPSDPPLQRLPLEPTGSLTRDYSFAKSDRRVPTAQSYLNGRSGQELAGVLTISTKALQSREKSNVQEMNEPQSSREFVRPGSSLNRLSQRPNSVKTTDQVINTRLSSARRGPTRVRLAPLDRAKTPNIEDDHRKEMTNQVLIGRRLQMFSERSQQLTNHDRLSSPAYMFRNTALPPIGLLESAESIGTALPQRHQRSLKAFMASRATSALAEKDIGQPIRERERSLMTTLDNRPSTTHTFRADTPFNIVGRRSSTPLGFSVARGNLQSNYVSSAGGGSLGITGNGIGTSHAHELTSHNQHLDEYDEDVFHDLSRNHWGSSAIRR